MSLTSREVTHSTDEAEAECRGALEEMALRVEPLPFDLIPGQSRLFLEYLRDPAALARFYPNAVRFHRELVSHAERTLAAHEVARAELCSALAEMNSRWGAGAETLANINRLADDKTVAVVTGQQVGLFTGPLYTIYKALSAVRLARCLTARGVEAVPVFWMATEDHDWLEVQAAEFIGCDGRLARAEARSEMHAADTPVGTVVLDDSIRDTLARLHDVLPTTEFTPELHRLLEESYAPGISYGDAFARLLTSLVKAYGLILLDPLDLELKRLAAPLYARAAERAPEIARALVERSRELTDAGYHAQVAASPDSFPLFLHANETNKSPGARRALVRRPDGTYGYKGGRESWTANELAVWAANEPARFSPNVTLRGSVQDYLLPTVCYLGGAAEIAYFAQTAEVYRALDRPVTTVLPRASLTLVEPRAGRTLERYRLSLPDLFAGEEHVTRRVVEEYLGAEGASLLHDAERRINETLDGLRQEFDATDPTLAGALDTGRRKINYQLETLAARYRRAQMSRHRAAHRQLERLFTALYPEQVLQERHLNITSLLARHGRYCMEWIYNSIDLGSADHQIVYL